MLKTIIKLTFIALFINSSGYGQVQVDRVEDNLIIEPSNPPLVLDASRSITINPTSHFKPGSDVLLHLVEDDTYIPTMFTTENYVFSRSFQTETTDPENIANNKDVIDKITYYDGLGRAIQDIQLKYTPDKYDLITHKMYDDLGRISQEFLPYKASGENGMYRSDALEKTNQYYVSNYEMEIDDLNPNPFSKKEFEDAFLNRPLKQALPGYDWRMNGGNEIEYSYKNNTAADAVRLFEVTFDNNNTQNPQLVEDGLYASNELTRYIVRDENHTSGSNHTMEEFKDKRGRIVLKRTYDGSKHDTYYVYDDYNNLTYVIPPKAANNQTISSSILNELCYQYRYDEKNRLIAKKFPGKGGPNNKWEYIVYNRNDQPIMTRSATDIGWQFTKYDAYGRIAYTGFLYNNADRQTLQNEANTSKFTFEVPKIGVTVINVTLGYGNRAYPTENFANIYTINYYDGQNFDTGSLALPESVYGQAITSNTNGLPNGSRVRILPGYNSYNWVTTLLGYDDKGRVIYEATRNDLLGTTDIQEKKLDFTGRVLETKLTHKKTSKDDIILVDTYEYDHIGRVLVQNQTIDGQTEVLLQQEYDDLGNLKQRKLGNTVEDPLQTVDYRYNIRGWLREINNVNVLESDLFAFKIGYNHTDVPVLGTQKLFNGNITQTQWRSKKDNLIRAYGFGYDGMDRIKTATFTDNVNTVTDQYSSSYAYDKNGNITDLTRNGWQDTSSYLAMDDLEYVYYDNSNKLKKVIDTGNQSYGFEDGNDNAEEFFYDANGNINQDLNKGMFAGYNHLNLPHQFTYNLDGDANFIYYTYDANGNKIQKRFRNNTINPGTFTTTQYSGDFIYENDELKFINHSQGYIEPKTDGTYDYVYQFRDHLKSTRLSFSDLNDNGNIEVANEIIEESNYYPFGLEHDGYANVLNGPEYNNKTFQGQEHHNDLGLNIVEFKYRFYNPEIGRFLSIDPIAEDFAYNSTYAFSENKLGMGIELEGLEVFSNADLFFLQRKAQEIVDQFSGGVTKVFEATTTDRVKNEVLSPDPSRGRIETISKMSSGLGDIAKSTGLPGAQKSIKNFVNFTAFQAYQTLDFLAPDGVEIYFSGDVEPTGDKIISGSGSVTGSFFVGNSIDDTDFAAGLTIDGGVSLGGSDRKFEGGTGINFFYADDGSGELNAQSFRGEEKNWVLSIPYRKKASLQFNFITGGTYWGFGIGVAPKGSIGIERNISTTIIAPLEELDKEVKNTITIDFDN